MALTVVHISICQMSDCRHPDVLTIHEPMPGPVFCHQSFPGMTRSAPREQRFLVTNPELAFKDGTNGTQEAPMLHSGV
jgi:hypothetical protein